MSIEIRQIQPTKAELKKFVEFATNLYNGNPFYVPSLLMDDINTLNPKKNAAFEFCESVYFMAYKDGKAVGRIAGIINRVVNEKYNEQAARFGWFDFENDWEISEGLMNAVMQWAREKGMTKLVGPLGFTDMDPEGMLVEGFDQVSTMATIYNFQYYVNHIERLGFAPENDWVEFKVYVPDEIPEKMVRISEIVKKKYELRTITPPSRRWFVRNYGQAMFEVINEAYKDFYGYSTLTPKQIKQYIGMYVPILRLDMVSLILDKDDKLVGVGISLPSMSQALIKNRGRIFPFGWLDLVKAWRKNTIGDLMLVAVLPEYQNKGVNALLFTHLIPHYQKNGYVYFETNPELEVNTSVQKQWMYFHTEQHKRRRAFSIDL